MTWTSPKTMGSEIGTSSDWNTYVRDNELYLYGLATGTTFSGVFLSRAASQSVSDSTATNISWDTENFDYGAWWSSGANITVPAGAIPTGFTTIAVWVIPILSFPTDADGKRRVIINKNGAEQERMTLSAVSDDPTIVILPTLITVVAADVITIQAYHTAGGALNVTASVKVIRHAAVA